MLLRRLVTKSILPSLQRRCLQSGAPEYRGLRARICPPMARRCLSTSMTDSDDGDSSSAVDMFNPSEVEPVSLLGHNHHHPRNELMCLDLSENILDSHLERYVLLKSELQHSPND